MENNEQHAFKCLEVLTSSFINEIHTVGAQKTFSIGRGFHLNLELLAVDRLYSLFLIRAMDDHELESCAWKVQSYSLGFLRAMTFEQHGVIQLRADRDDLQRDYETYAKINGFFQQFLDVCISDLQPCIARMGYAA